MRKLKENKGALDIFDTLQSLEVPHAIFITYSEMAVGIAGDRSNEYYICVPGDFITTRHRSTMRKLGFQSSYEYSNNDYQDLNDDEILPEGLIRDASRLIRDLTRKEIASINSKLNKYTLASDTSDGLVYEFTDYQLLPYLELLDDPEPYLEMAIKLSPRDFGLVTNMKRTSVTKFRRMYLRGEMSLPTKKRIAISFYKNL